MKYLNLGCQIRKFPNERGWINIDLDDSVKPDILCDVKKLPFEDNEVDFIYAAHLLEHIYLDKVPEYLREWMRVLKPGGKLAIVVPDIGTVMRRYASGEYTLDHALAPLLGRWYSWDPDAERHRYQYDYMRLTQVCTGNYADWAPFGWTIWGPLNLNNLPLELRGLEIPNADWQMGIILTK